MTGNPLTETLPASETGADARRLKTLEQLLFFFLVAAVTVPAWLVESFPSQDGPIHLHIVHLMASYAALDGSIVQTFFVPNARIEPNVGFYVLAYPFALLFGVETALRIFLTLVAFLYCYGVRYAVATLDRHNTYLAYIAIPSTYHFFVHMGFFNFVLGVALFLPALAYSIKTYHSTRKSRFLAIMAVALLVAYVHLFCFVLFAVALAGYAFVQALTQQRKVFSMRTLMNLLRGPLVGLGLALLPATLVLVVFTGEHGITYRAPSMTTLTLFQRLLRLDFLYSFDRPEEYAHGHAILGLMAVVTAFAILNRQGGLKDPDKVLARAVILVAFLALYFMPNISPARVPIAPRVVPVFFLSFLFFLSSFSISARVKRVVIGCCVILVGTDVALRTAYYRAIDAEMQNFLAVEGLIEEGSLILPIDMQTDRPHQLLYKRPSFSEHIGANLARTTNSVYLGSTLMSPTFYPYFPFQFRMELDPFAHLGRRIFRYDPPVDFEAFAQAAGRRVDYVIISGAADFDEQLTSSGPDEKSDVRRELRTRYDHAWRSEDGRHHLYALRDRGEANPQLSYSAWPALGFTDI